jgi:hypothetical protein
MVCTTSRDKNLVSRCWVLPQVQWDPLPTPGPEAASTYRKGDTGEMRDDPRKDDWRLSLQARFLHDLAGLRTACPVP